MSRPTGSPKKVEHGRRQVHDRGPRRPAGCTWAPKASRNPSGARSCVPLICGVPTTIARAGACRAHRLHAERRHDQQHVVRAERVDPPADLPVDKAVVLLQDAARSAGARRRRRRQTPMARHSAGTSGLRRPRRETARPGTAWAGAERGRAAQRGRDRRPPAWDRSRRRSRPAGGPPSTDTRATGSGSAGADIRPRVGIEHRRRPDRRWAIDVQARRRSCGAARRSPGSRAPARPAASAASRSRPRTRPGRSTRSRADAPSGPRRCAALPTRKPNRTSACAKQ